MIDLIIITSKSKLKEVLKNSKVSNKKINKILTEVIAHREKNIFDSIKHDLKKVATENKNVDLFNRLLFTIRKNYNHRISKSIHKTDKNYFLLIEITEDAIEFSDSFKLNFNDGFTIYIKSLLKLCGNKYSLNKFKTYKEKIFYNYSIIDKAKSLDIDNLKLTEIVLYYYNKISTFTDDEVKKLLKNNYTEFLLLYYHIVSKKINFKNYIDFQFKFYKKCFENIPQIIHLNTDNAVERYLEFELLNKNKSKKSSNNAYWKELEKRKNK